MCEEERCIGAVRAVVSLTTRVSSYGPVTKFKQITHRPIIGIYAARVGCQQRYGNPLYNKFDLMVRNWHKLIISNRSSDCYILTDSNCFRNVDTQDNMAEYVPCCVGITRQIETCTIELNLKQDWTQCRICWDRIDRSKYAVFIGLNIGHKIAIQPYLDG